MNNENEIPKWKKNQTEYKMKWRKENIEQFILDIPKGKKLN